MRKYTLVAPAALVMLASPAMARSAATCEYTGVDQQYRGSCGPQQAKAAFRAFCRDMDGVRGAYSERGACTRLLHPTTKPQACQQGHGPAPAWAVAIEQRNRSV